MPVSPKVLPTSSRDTERGRSLDDDTEVELGWDIYATVTDSALITRTNNVLVAVSDRAAARRALADQDQTEDSDNQNDQEGPR
ncbi:hypothetical protein [Rhodococcus sp. 14-2483-1-2]|uniref:hypothetical protein n=1 Tax=Rhodococcus sp. 14-2483-1-2 TaxID=2023147 RepID=UPI000B9A636E|nr:hypothetical protein [Rhodococcus sp. 14-2483-1-2]OZF38241.1 hypothetical protein CH295_04345 [Rhodococcus sp. 14-2483-1-2]